MENWIELTSEQFLSADKMNAIYNDFIYLKNQLEEKGYNVFEVTDNTVTYIIHPTFILSKMEKVETNIQNLDAVIDWVNPYYSIYKWAKHSINKKSQVDRWIMYLNFVYDVLSGNVPPSAYLVDKDNNRIVDEYNNYILVYKE